MLKLKSFVVGLTCFLCLNFTANSQSQEVPKHFQSDLIHIKHNFIDELENDNGEKVLDLLDDLIYECDRALDAWDQPAYYYREIRNYKKAFRSLEFFLKSAAGFNDEVQFEEFLYALDFLGLEFVIKKETNYGGRIIIVEFGPPSYIIYFYYNPKESALKQCKYTFKGNRKVGMKWYYLTIINGSFGYMDSDIEGFARFREIPSINNVKLTSFSCKPFTN